MSVSSAAAQQKFTNLRKRLDQLGYRQPLGVESLPLVEKLFADLIHTTDSLKNAKLQASRCSKEHGTADSSIEPYKSDNAKLVRENNDLHVQLIKVKEEGDAQIKELKASLRRMEHDMADLKFLNNQYVHKMRALEKESKAKTERILQLQEKNFHAVVQTPGGRKKNIPFRRQRMEIDCPVPPAEPHPYPSQADDPYIADLLKVADDRIGQLTQDNKDLRNQLDQAQIKLKASYKKVDTRDAEIERLSNLLDGGRPYDVVALETRNRSNERLISHLNIQVDYLQQKNQELQRRLDKALTTERKALSTSFDLDARNKELEHELQNVDHMARQLQTDKDMAISIGDREITDAKIEIEKSTKELESLDQEIAQLRAERDRLVNQTGNLKGKLSTERVEKGELDDLVTKLQEDKRRLGQRVNKLLQQEKDLVLEVHRLRHKNQNGVVKKKGKGPNPVEGFIRTLEEDRDYWKGEVDVLNRLLKSRSRSPSPRASRRTASPVRSPSRSANVTPTKPRSRAASPSPASKNRKKAEDKSPSHYEAILRVLEEERNHYKKECERLRASSPRAASPNRSFRDKSTENELIQVRRERDELQALLEKFERHMSEIQANIQVLTSERDKLNNMYEDAKMEVQRLRQEVVRSPKSPKTSLAAQAVLRRVENERDDAIADLRRMTTERDSLRERLKIATETQLSDRARLDQRVEDLENILRDTEIERNELSRKKDSLQKLVNELESQLRTVGLKLADTQDEAGQHQATSNQMRVLAEETERALEETKRLLNQREAELRAAQDNMQILEERLSQVTRASNSDQDHIVQLKGTLSSLDREKDTLQHIVDEKAETIARLQEDLAVKEAKIREQRTSMHDLETAVGFKNDTLDSRETEIKSLRRQLDSVNEELAEVARGREVALRENRRLQEDLATMTRENQNVNQDLQDAVDEREQLKAQLQDYVIEVKRIEELLSAKDTERTDLLEQYRTLSVEAERYETQTHQLESEGSNLRLELVTRDGELRRQRERMDDLEKELHQHIQVNHDYELQVSKLTKSVADLEGQLRVADQEKLGLVQDLSAVRDLCARLEASKDSLQRQLTNKSLEQDKLSTLVEDLKEERELLRGQVSQERESARGLEDLLHSNREKEFHSQLESQERNTEIQLLKDRLSLNESKLESQSREITNLRTRNIELESEVDQLRRKVTNERFERERAVQELRRNGIPPPVETSRLSRLSTSPSALSSGEHQHDTAGSPTTLRTRSPARSPYRSSARDEDDDPLTSTHTV